MYHKKKICHTSWFFLKKGKIFNISDLEQNLVTFNRYNENVQLKGSLEAGKEEETTDTTETKEAPVKKETKNKTKNMLKELLYEKGIN